MNQHIARYLEINNDTHTLTLGELARELRKQDPETTLALGFNGPHSWRRDYQFIAFEPVGKVKVKDMLEDVESSIGKTFIGYKGGDYTMTVDTPVYLSYYGECGNYDEDALTQPDLDVMLSSVIDS